MAGKRKQESGLPPRVYVYAGARGETYYYLNPDNKRVNLGHDLVTALELHAQLSGRAKSTSGPSSAAMIEETGVATELWKACRKNAGSRKIPFALTLDDVEQLVKRSGLKCEVTGIKFNDIKPDGMRVRPWRASLDRKDSAIGYTAENCRLVCTSVNLAMNQFGESFFGTLLEAMMTIKLEPIVELILQKKLADYGMPLK